MSIHLFSRLERLNFLIKSRSTGTPQALAKKLAVSERSLYVTLDLMKDLGAPICYCKQCKTYYYAEEGNLTVRFLKKSKERNASLKVLDQLEKV
jgi:predicted DNA-binding transcriptional regulator YafY